MIENLPEGQRIESSTRPIVGSNGVFWAIRVERDSKGLGVVYLWVSRHEKINAHGTLYVGPADPIKFGDNEDFDINVICIGLYFPRLDPDCVIWINVMFTDLKRGTIFVPLAINDFIRDFNHYTPDAKIVVDDKTFDVHRHLLCMISPVFQAEFAYDTGESKTGTVKITDFDFKTIKNVIDYCYGRDHEIKTVLDCVNLLRFADKYDIRIIIKMFEPLLYDSISLYSFCEIAQYAWDSDQLDEPIGCVTKINAPTVHTFMTDSDHYSTDAQIVVGDQRIDVHRYYLSLLSPVFYNEFKESTTDTIQVPDFNFSVVQNVIDYCYGKVVTIETLINTVNILRFGHKYSIPRVVEKFEEAILEDLSKDNFCSIVQYAWEYKKADLKLKCADFYRSNYDCIQFTPDFLTMDSAIIADVLRLASSVEKPEEGKSYITARNPVNRQPPTSYSKLEVSG
uniref:BTB domain-containing protein n=1 Tax=Panagrellus redivivus TaxID=6233 RepID=A0A7E4V9V0_PANRE